MVYQYSFKRSQHDNRAINEMIERAEAVAAGTRPLKKDRFVKITDAVKGVDWDLVERARHLAGLKGYVTNIAPDTMDGCRGDRGLPRPLPGRAVVPDDQVRPAAPGRCSTTRDSIEAHLTIVFAALAVSRYLQEHDRRVDQASSSAPCAPSDPRPYGSTAPDHPRPRDPGGSPGHAQQASASRSLINWHDSGQT